MSSIINIDFETCSTVDLRRVGVFKYAESDDTDVICGCYTLPGDNAARAWVPSRTGYNMPIDLRGAAATIGSEIHTWNAGFEYSIWDLLARRHRWAMPRADQFHCTMARAAYWALPASLALAGEVVGVEETKATARGLMLQMSRPRGFDIVDGNPIWWHRTDSKKLDDLVEYCRRDVLAERAIGRVLRPLPEIERRTWLLDQEMNRRGIHVDLELTESLSRVVEQATVKLRADLRRVTRAAVTSLTEVPAFGLWLQKQGIDLPNLRRESLTRLYYTMEDGPAKEAIGIRLSGVRTSTRKLQALKDATCKDGAIRGITRYFGAPRTGRWSGAGGANVQPQNVPRPIIKDVETATRIIRSGASAADLELLYEESAMDIVMSCLRSCFVAPRGHKLVVPDFSQIEARVLATLAGQQDVLEVFARNEEDIYSYDARMLGSSNRQLGKVTRLGLGYQMGPERFVATAATYGVNLDIGAAIDIVVDWRRTNSNITSFWFALDDALRALIDAPPLTQYAVGAIRLGKNRGGTAILVYLPSGRLLIYRNLHLVPSDRDKPAMVYTGVSQATKRWGLIKLYGGKLAENITQAVARDVMRDAMLVAAENGFDLRLTVHDELIALAADDAAPEVFERLLEIMRKPPTWLPTLPVWASGYISQRYRKG
jgi:DNA polymerase